MEEGRQRKIIFYGDSNTYGYDPADPYERRYPYEERWTTIVSENLKDHFQVIPEGMNGRMLPEILYEQSYLMRLIRLAGHDGILCTMLGTNDILLTVHPDASATVRKMEQYIPFLKKHLDSSQILIIAPPLIGSGGTWNPLPENYYRESKRMNDAFRTIAAREGVLFSDASEWGIDLAYDQVHFSAEGHRMFAVQVTTTILSLVSGRNKISRPG